MMTGLLTRRRTMAAPPACRLATLLRAWPMRFRNFWTLIPADTWRWRTLSDLWTRQSHALRPCAYTTPAWASRNGGPRSASGASLHKVVKSLPTLPSARVVQEGTVSTRSQAYRLPRCLPSATTCLAAQAVLDPGWGPARTAQLFTLSSLEHWRARLKAAPQVDWRIWKGNLRRMARRGLMGCRRHFPVPHPAAAVGQPI